MVTKQFRVPDVSCEHCVNAITNELTAIEGVHDVQVDLEAKIVTVQADAAVSDESIVAGLDEAGYDITA